MTTTAQVDLRALIERDTVLHWKSGTDGGEYQGPCPFCGGHDRFHVWPLAERPHWWCRICEACGDAVDYVRRRHAVGFREACRILGVSTDERDRYRPRPAPAVVPVDESPPPDAWQATARRFVSWTQEQLQSEDGAAVRTYLQEQRGLTEATICAAGLGYNPRDWYLPPAAWGLDGPKKIWLPRGVVIPCEAQGAIWYVKIRRPVAGDELAAAIGDPAHGGPSGKFIQPRGSKPALFGTDQIARHLVAILTEGELDALLLRQVAGDLVDVVTLGSASAPLHGRWMWALRHAASWLVAYDSDPAGKLGAARVAAVSGRARIVHPLDGKDLTEMHLAGGNLRAWARYLVARYEGPSTRRVAK